MSLIKRLFLPKKDYVKIFEQFNDEGSLNEFLQAVNKKGGKLIEIQNTAYVETNSEIVEKSYQTNEYGTALNSIIHDKTTIHYRCYEKINFLTTKEKEYLKKLEEEEIKHFEKRSRMSVDPLKKESYRELEEKKITNERKEDSSENESLPDDLPF